MTLNELLQTQNLEHSLLIGYYGGGNYGDELLLEVLINALHRKNNRRIEIAYQAPSDYKTYHHDLGYSLVPMHSKRSLLKAMMRNRNIIIGGGGLWGVDMNPNVFLLSLLLFMAKWLLGKKIFLIGVGYYASTSRLGHIGAWLAAKAASHVIARDEETERNFKELTKHLSLDKDIAWSIPGLDLEHYASDLLELEKRVSIQDKTIVITLRRFKTSLQNNYREYIEDFLAHNKDKPILILIMEPRSVDDEDYRRMLEWQKMYKRVQIVDFSYNPLALYLLFQKHSKRLAFIGPQFHMILTAHLNDVPFLPVAYDNKVIELLKQIGDDAPIPIQSLQLSDIQSFADRFYKTQESIHAVSI